jgi:hypothetical protein
VIPVCASIASAIVAAVVSFIAGRGLKEHEWRLAVAKDRLADRRSLYGRFLSESDSMLSASIASQQPLTMERFTQLISLNAEISLVGNEEIRKTAQAVCALYLSLLTSKENQNEEGGDFFATKSAFLKAARLELEGLEREFAKKDGGGFSNRFSARSVMSHGHRSVESG